MDKAIYGAGLIMYFFITVLGASGVYVFLAGPKKVEKDTDDVAKHTENHVSRFPVDFSVKAAVLFGINTYAVFFAVWTALWLMLDVIGK